jgi:hypothetical protein
LNSIFVILLRCVLRAYYSYNYLLRYLIYKAKKYLRFPVDAVNLLPLWMKSGRGREDDLHALARTSADKLACSAGPSQYGEVPARKLRHNF